MSEDRLKARPRLPLNWRMNRPLASGKSERKSAKQAAYEARSDALSVMPLLPRQFTRTPSRKPITLHKGPVL
jgi:hypothetical protein